MSPRTSRLTRASLLKLTPVVSLALLCAAKTGPLRAEDKLDKKVVEIVKKVGDLYKNARTLHAEGTLVTKVDGQKQEINVTAVIDFERPNHISFRTQLNGDAKKGLDVISDGKTLTIYRKERKQYVQEDAPKDVSGLGARLQQFGPPLTGILFANVLNEDPAEALMAGVNSSSYAGIEKVDGTPAHHMKFSQEFDWEMWVAVEGKPLVLQMSMSAGGENAKMTHTETYKNWKLDAPVGKETFQFSAPKDATKVDEFKEAN
jgi:hypothetical protein